MTTPSRLVYGRTSATTLDAILLNVTDKENLYMTNYLQRAEKARQLARLHIENQQSVDSRRYNLQRSLVQYQPGDRVWVWTLICCRGLNEKPLRHYFAPYIVFQHLGKIDYEVAPDSITNS